jgi:hypothetical protein
LFARIRNFLKPPIIETQNSNDLTGSRYQFVDVNGKCVHVWFNNYFNQSNIIEQSNYRFGLYNSDPEVAHKNCSFREWNSYHMIEGRIYKCGPVALMPQFDDQYLFDISEQDRTIMRAYQGLRVDEFDTRGQEFLDTIDLAIPQCKFCPETYDTKLVSFTTLKPNKL